MTTEVYMTNNNESEDKKAADDLNARVTTTLENADREILMEIIKKLAKTENTGSATPAQLSFYTSLTIMRAYADALYDYYERLANAH